MTDPILPAKQGPCWGVRAHNLWWHSPTDVQMVTMLYLAMCVVTREADERSMVLRT